MQGIDLAITKGTIFLLTENLIMATVALSERMGDGFLVRGNLLVHCQI